MRSVWADTTTSFSVKRGPENEQSYVQSEIRLSRGWENTFAATILLPSINTHRTDVSMALVSSLQLSHVSYGI